MRDKFAPCLYKLRWVLPIITCAMAGGGAAILANNFEEGEQQFFPENHPVTLIDEIQQEKFGSSTDFKFANVFMYGLNPTTPMLFPKSSNFFANTEDEFEDEFVLQYDSNYYFTPSDQIAIVTNCDAMSNDTTLVPSGEVYCILNELKASNPAAFPYADATALRTALVAFYSTPAYAALNLQYDGYASFTGFMETDNQESVLVLWQSANTTIPTTIDRGIPPQIKPYYDNWDAKQEQECPAEYPCVMANREGLFSSMATLDAMRTTALINIGLALAVSYVVLVLVTFNLLVPILALLSIASTIVWSLSVVFLAGYRFNANAAILSVMAVGLAVDYAVHMVHFYNHAKSSTRYDKTQDALFGVGISIIGGAATTAFAAVPLLFVQNFVFFLMAGWFIFFTAVFGIFFTFFQLTPLLMAIGPTGACGDIGPLCGCARKSPPVSSTSQSAEASASPL